MKQVQCLVPLRINNLLSLGVQIKDRKTELARLETMDNGKPIAEAEADMVRF